MHQTQLDPRRNIFSEQKLLWSANPNISVHKKVFAECLTTAGINSKRWSVDNSTFQRCKINQSGAISSWPVLIHRSHYSRSCYYHLQYILNRGALSQHPFHSPPSCPYLHFSSSSMFGWNSPDGLTRSNDSPQVYDILNRGRRARWGKAVIRGKNTIPNQTKWINNRGCRHTFILAVHVHRELVYQPMWSACWHRRLASAAHTLTVWYNSGSDLVLNLALWRGARVRARSRKQKKKKKKKSKLKPVRAPAANLALNRLAVH